MEVKIGDKVRGQHWNNGYFVTVNEVYHGKRAIYIEGKDENETDFFGYISYANLEILPPEPEYEICEEIEFSFSDSYSINIGIYPDDYFQETKVSWKQKTGRKFKKFTDGCLELVEDKA